MKTIFSMLFFVFISTHLFAQEAADKVSGSWFNTEATAKIQIYKTTTGHYAGKIVWLKEPMDPETGKPKIDKHNPDKSKRSVPILELVNLKGFTYNADDKVWEHGNIYDPKNGKDYSCKMQLADANTLKVRGYIGISLLGRTETWKRDVKK